MASEKLFTVAGYATNPNGTVKVRFANDLVARIKILNKAGCTNINLIELPTAMSKLEALQHLQAQGITEGDVGFVVANKLTEKQKLADKASRKVTLKTGGKDVKVAKATTTTKIETTEATEA